ncbi:MAG: hypothetical protein QM754_14675 [Tepidisphaeraceae bacterium]
MSDSRDYILDISSLRGTEPEPAQPPPKSPSSKSASPMRPQMSHGGRPFISVFFKCCSVYQRVYRNADGKTYTGRCPKCLGQVRFVVGDGGTGERSFVVE